MPDHSDTRRGALALIGGGAIGLGALALSSARIGAQAPGRKLGYAIVGLGGYATGQIMPRFARCERSRLAALVSGTPAKLERYGEEYGVPRTHRYSYQNFDRIRDNPDIDIVYVVLPNSLHAEYSIRAAQAGKHVLCEKPMATTAAECEAMVAASKRAGRKLMIGYRSRFEAHNRLAIRLALEGEVGRTRLIAAEHGFSAQPNQWRLDRKLAGGGSLMDIGIYSLNAARYLTGEEPVALSAVESTDRRDPRFASVEDRIDFMLRFPSGVIANCMSSYSSNHNRYRVVGDKGWIDMEPATSYDGQKMRTSKDGRTEDRKPPPQPADQFVGQLDHLSECVQNGREPIVPGEEGLRDLRLIEAIYRSARERRHVALS